MFGIEGEQNSSEQNSIVTDSTESTSSVTSQEQSTSSDSQSTGSGTVAQMTRDELATMLQESETRAATSAATSLSASVTEQVDALSAGIESLGTFSIAPEQYEQIVKLGASELHSQVFCLGLLSLILGAVIATAVTLHWRARA